MVGKTLGSLTKHIKFLISDISLYYIECVKFRFNGKLPKRNFEVFGEKLIYYLYYVVDKFVEF